MLSTEKIRTAFDAICEEAESLKNQDLPEDAQKRVDVIISIAKHQNDIRGARSGACKAHGKA